MEMDRHMINNHKGKCDLMLAFSVKILLWDIQKKCCSSSLRQECNKIQEKLMEEEPNDLFVKIYLNVWLEGITLTA